MFYALIYKKILLRWLLRRVSSEDLARAVEVIRKYDRLFFENKLAVSRSSDLVCLVPHGTKGWILDGIAREILRYWPLKGEIAYRVKNLPCANTYFVAEQTLVKRAILSAPWVLQGTLFVWYTHPLGRQVEGQDLVFWLNQTTKVVTTNSHLCDELIAQGVSREKVTYVIGGAEPELFRGHERRSDGVVGMSMAYYERKDPDRVLSVVKAMPHRSFVLVGRNWKDFPKFNELLRCENFEYLESPYEDYPKIYRRFSVFLSPARLEGGPIPLLETMMENVVPVASDTGFARDIIEHGVNGYVFPTDASTEKVCGLIDEAFANTSDVRSTVMQYSWERFTQRLHELAAK